MGLKVKDVADLLNVSETTIRRWVAEGKIPSYKINNHDRFSRPEIQNWVISHNLNAKHPITLFDTSKEANGIAELPKKGGTKQFSLFRALHKGDVLYKIPGKSKEDVIRYTMKKIAKNLHVDAEVMTELLLEREKLMPTALNNGIGIPHTRDSLLNGHNDAIYIIFPEEPLDYGALDGKPVDILFFLFACDDKRHLHLLAKIAHLSNQSEFLKLLKTNPTKNSMLEYIKQWEISIISENS